MCYFVCHFALAADPQQRGPWHTLWLWKLGPLQLPTWIDFVFPCCSRSVETVISIQHNEESAFSTLHIKTLDRPGLLVEIVKVLKDINVNVISAEVRTPAP